jgi:hypothetical protein
VKAATLAALFAPFSCVYVATTTAVITTSPAFYASGGDKVAAASLELSAHRAMDPSGCLDGFTVLA